MIWVTATPQFELPCPVTLNAKGAAFQQREWVRVCTIGKTLGMKSTVQVIHSSLVPQCWSWLRAWQHSRWLQRQSVTVEGLAPHPRAAHTCSLCYFCQGRWRAPVRAWISLQPRHSAQPVGEFNQAELSMLGVGVKRNAKEKMKTGGVSPRPRMMWNWEGSERGGEPCSAPTLFVFSDLFQFCCCFGGTALQLCLSRQRTV